MLSLKEARQIITTEPLKFGNETQIAAANKIEDSGARSDAQVRRWKEAKARAYKILAQHLEHNILLCPHCDRAPWSKHLGNECGQAILKAYDIKERIPVSWIRTIAQQWHLANPKQILRFVSNSYN